jgi:hypothetical protein
MADGDIYAAPTLTGIGFDLGDKTAYGFRQTLATGHLNVEIVRDSTTPVQLPVDNLVRADDYRLLFFSSDTIRFQWGASGHLQMVIY